VNAESAAAIAAGELEPVGSLRPAAYHQLARKLARQRAAEDIVTRVALLSSNSFSFLEPFLAVEAHRVSVPIDSWVAPFGQIEQPVLDAASEMWGSEPDVIVVAIRIEDTHADAFYRSRRADKREMLFHLGKQTIERLIDVVTACRDKSGATILVANFSVPAEQNRQSVFDANFADGNAHTISRLNAMLCESVSDMAGVTIWDYAGLVNSRGALEWTDQRLWSIARQPISASNMPYAGAHLARTIRGVLNPRAKCLVLDLDNTLWGGAAGDDGLEGIALGDDFPGSAFKAFQRAVLGLRDEGVLLAISSKNDEAVARSIIDQHPEMLLSWEDFSATRINWQAKSQNLIKIAQELNIGRDSLVFFDDNPVEREEVRINAPEVKVIEVPDQPVSFPGTLFASGFFDTPTLSAEDASRAAQYKEESHRKELIRQSASLDEFLQNLDMSLTIGEAGPETIGRIAQLVNKTNQFNLTTRRYSPAELQAMTDADDVAIRWYRLADRFGDSGLIAVSIVRYANDTATIDSLLMSCRVMGRQVERAVVSDVEKQAAQRQCRELLGLYVPTDRNSIVAELYDNCGFSKLASTAGEDGTTYSLDVTTESNKVKWPEVISLTTS